MAVWHNLPKTDVYSSYSGNEIYQPLQVADIAEHRHDEIASTALSRVHAFGLIYCLHALDCWFCSSTNWNFELISQLFILIYFKFTLLIVSIYIYVYSNVFQNYFNQKRKLEQHHHWGRPCASDIYRHFIGMNNPI